MAHPLRTLTQRLRLTQADGPGPPRTYVRCTEGKEGQAAPPYVQRISADPEWRPVELHATHTAHVTAPGALAATLLDIAGT